MANKSRILGFLIYLIFALYFINSALNLIEMPGFLNNINNWIILVGGILILIGGVNYLRAGRYKY